MSGEECLSVEERWFWTHVAGRVLGQVLARILLGSSANQAGLPREWKLFGSAIPHTCPRKTEANTRARMHGVVGGGGSGHNSPKRDLGSAKLPRGQSGSEIGNMISAECCGRGSSVSGEKTEMQPAL